MFSLAAFLGFMTLAAFIVMVSAILRQLGLGALAALIAGSAVLGVVFAVVGAMLSADASLAGAR